MSTLFFIYYIFWSVGIFPLANAIVERPEDWRLWASLLGMLGAAIVAIFMDAEV
jgi:hypothetical protein